jgi:hypothetical protein
MMLRGVIMVIGSLILALVGPPLLRLLAGR